MADAQAITTTPRLPVRMGGFRDVATLVGIAASVAIGVGVVLWMQKPDFQLLYGSLTDRDAGAVVEGLEGSGIPYRVSGESVLVPADKVHEARLKLAAQGLPRGTSMGLEIIEEQKGLGSSQFIETARYHHALETELARTVASIQSVQSARVHLAMPRQSSLLVNRNPPSASVLVNLFPGRQLDKSQVAAVAHLVASSIPGLVASQVTVIDQTGRLLNSPDSDDGGPSAAQLDYAHRVEENYSRRIVALLEPLVGAGKVRAEVNAAIDFTRAEEMRESFGTERSALRSEQTSEDIKRGGLDALGIPGALTNQPPEDVPQTPPAAQTRPSAAASDEASATVAAASEPVSTSRKATRNYEIDRTLSRTQPAVGNLRRLSVAVLVDSNPVVPAGDAAGATLANQPADIERMTRLVKEAIGFDEQRGDTVSVESAAFQVDAVADEGVSGVPFWQHPMLLSLLRQLGGVLLVALIVFTVLKPVARRLAEPGLLTGGRVPGGTLLPSASLPGSAAGGVMLQGLSHEQQVAGARNLVGQDPRRVAQTMKRWLEHDG